MSKYRYYVFVKRDQKWSLWSAIREDSFTAMVCDIGVATRMRHQRGK